MFNFNFKKYPPILGIDISSTSIKIVEMSGKEGHQVVEGYGYQLLPPHAVEGHTIKDVDAVGQVIKQVIERNQLKSKLAVLSVPDSLVISKVMQVNEGLRESEIEALVLLEADKFVPFPMEEISIDFDIIGHSDRHTARVDVFVVASRSENITARIEAARRASLDVKIIDLESFAIERACRVSFDHLIPQSKNKSIAVIDIGASFANLFVLKNKDIIFTREEKFGMEMINSFIETSLLHVKRALQFFYSASHHTPVDHIILIGGIARDARLVQAIGEEIKIPTMSVNPFFYLTVGKKLNPDFLATEAPLFMTACGLALRNSEKAL